MIVVDASALIEVILGAPAAGAIEARMFRPGESLHAPHLVDVEVASVLRRLVLSGKIDGNQGRSALEDHASFLIERYSHISLVSTAWQLRENVTAYDAMYVALAQALDAPLLTHDGKLASAAASFVDVELV